MLSAEQLEMRQTGIGASEGGSILGLNPFKGPLDVWLRKRTLSRGPIIDESKAPEDPKAQAGTFMEPAARALYTARTGIKLRTSTTLRHPDLPFVLATPDGLAVNDNGEDLDSGAELKFVGARMLHHWADSTVPDYVVVQAIQNMAVTGRSRWDVGAFLGGTDFQIWTFERDLEVERDVLNACEHFFEAYILGDTPPPEQSAEERKRYLRARYPGSEKTPCRRVEADEVTDTIAKLVDAKKREEAAKEEAQAVTNQLCELVGDDYGVEWDRGKFLWYPVRGKVDWKALAEEALGAVSPDLIERHRGEGYRVPRHYPKAEKKPGKGRSK